MDLSPQLLLSNQQTSSVVADVLHLNQSQMMSQSLSMAVAHDIHRAPYRPSNYAGIEDPGYLSQEYQ